MLRNCQTKLTACRKTSPPGSDSSTCMICMTAHAAMSFALYYCRADVGSGWGSVGLAETGLPCMIHSINAATRALHVLRRACWARHPVLTSTRSYTKSCPQQKVELIIGPRRCTVSFSGIPSVGPHRWSISTQALRRSWRHKSIERSKRCLSCNSSRLSPFDRSPNPEPLRTVRDPDGAAAAHARTSESLSRLESADGCQL